MASAVPGAKVGALMTAGFTDSHWLREAFGTVAYGFFPSSGEMPAEVSATLVHSADERIPVEALDFGTEARRASSVIRRLDDGVADRFRAGGAFGFEQPERAERVVIEPHGDSLGHVPVYRVLYDNGPAIFCR